MEVVSTNTVRSSIWASRESTNTSEPTSVSVRVAQRKASVSALTLTPRPMAPGSSSRSHRAPGPGARTAGGFPPARAGRDQVNVSSPNHDGPQTQRGVQSIGARSPPHRPSLTGIDLALRPFRHPRRDRRFNLPETAGNPPRPDGAGAKFRAHLPAGNPGSSAHRLSPSMWTSAVSPGPAIATSNSCSDHPSGPALRSAHPSSLALQYPLESTRIPDR